MAWGEDMFQIHLVSDKEVNLWTEQRAIDFLPIVSPIVSDNCKLLICSKPLPFQTFVDTYFYLSIYRLFFPPSPERLTVSLMASSRNASPSEYHSPTLPIALPMMSLLNTFRENQIFSDHLRLWLTSIWRVMTKNLSSQKCFSMVISKICWFCFCVYGIKTGSWFTEQIYLQLYGTLSDADESSPSLQPLLNRTRTPKWIWPWPPDLYPSCGPGHSGFLGSPWPRYWGEGNRFENCQFPFFCLFFVSAFIAFFLGWVWIWLSCAPGNHAPLAL